MSKKPNADQVGDAVDLIKEHHRQYGSAATEARLSALVYSIWSVLTGDGKPAADHEAALEAARRERNAAAVTQVEDEDDTEDDDDPVEDDDIDEFDRDELDGMTVADLKQLASDEGIDLGSATTKAAIIDAIMAS